MPTPRLRRKLTNGHPNPYCVAAWIIEGGDFFPDGRKWAVWCGTFTSQQEAQAAGEEALRRLAPYSDNLRLAVGS
jgi:hypothetical protein